MDANQREKLNELCSQIALEQDPTKFTKLVKELNQLLAGKEKKLEKQTILLNQQRPN